MIVGIKCAECDFEMDKATFYVRGTAYVMAKLVPMLEPLAKQVASDYFLPKRGIVDCVNYVVDSIEAIIDAFDTGIAGYAQEMHLECPKCKKVVWQRIEISDVLIDAPVNENKMI